MSVCLFCVLSRVVQLRLAFACSKGLLVPCDHLRITHHLRLFQRGSCVSCSPLRHSASTSSSCLTLSNVSLVSLSMQCVHHSFCAVLPFSSFLTCLFPCVCPAFASYVHFAFLVSSRLCLSPILLCRFRQRHIHRRQHQSSQQYCKQ